MAFWNKINWLDMDTSYYQGGNEKFGEFSI